MARDSRKQRSPQSDRSTAILVPALERFAANRRAVWILGGTHALIMLFIGLRYHVVGDYGVETDFFWSYVPSAKEVLSGAIAIEDFRGPVYPMALAFLNLFVGSYFTSGIVLSTLSASVAVMASFSLLRLHVRQDAAFLGTLVVAGGSFFVQYTYTAGTDMLFTALLLSGSYLLLRNQSLHRRDLILASLLFAVAYLTRYNGIFVVVAVPAVIMIVNPFSLEPKERMRESAIALGAFLVFISPWGTYCLVEKGSFFYSLNHLNIAYEMFARGNVSWDQYWATAKGTYSSLLSVLMADPGRFIGRVVVNAYEHGYADLTSLLGWFLGIPAVVGFVTMTREKPGKQLGAFYMFFGLNFSILLLVFYGERFSMSLMPAYVLGAVWLLSHPMLRKWRLWRTIPLGGLLLLGILGATVQRSYAYNDEMIASGPTELIEISHWVGKHLPAKTGEERPIVVSRKPHVGYYLDMRWEYFPLVQTYPELREELKKLHADYLLFGLMEAGMRPEFRYLLDPAKAPPELVPVVYTVSPPTVLYKLEFSEE